jgi:excisionase family DNA binding protein
MKIHDIENATKTEAATFFRCSTRTIDRWIHGGQLSAFRGPGRRVLIPSKELIRRLRPSKPVDEDSDG